ncbi:hypothetical protein RJ55_06702 [Drechmeria coniospora]|nr:hypothetical protein RJ55_06702 [Drechmeria coniospora]
MRVQIWALTVEARVVPVHIRFKTGVSDTSKTVVPHLTSSTPVPNILHICRESRYQNFFYDKFFLTIQGAEPSYVWVNFDIDIIDVGPDVDYTYYKGYAFREYFWACEPENLFFIDKERRRMLSFPELEKWLEHDDWYKTQDEMGVSVPDDMALAAFGIEGQG